MPIRVYPDTSIFIKGSIGTTPTAGISQQNSTASTSSVAQFAPGSESIGHGWTYLPGVAGTLSRAASSTVTVNLLSGTTTGFQVGGKLNIYVGPGVPTVGGSGGTLFSADGYTTFSTFIITSITPPSTMTYIDSIDVTNTGTTAELNIFDDSGSDNTVKVNMYMKAVSGQSFSSQINDQGMAFPEMVYQRSSWPNNGAYADWFKLSAGGTGGADGNQSLNRTPGVKFQTLKTDGVTWGTYLILQPGNFSLIDDNNVGFYSFPSTAVNNPNFGVVSLTGALFPNLHREIGESIGIPTSYFFDLYISRTNGNFIALGDVATPGWYNGGSTYLNSGNMGTLSASNQDFNNKTLMPNSLAALYVYGGQSSFKPLNDMGTLTVTPTGGAANSYTYYVVAVDSNGFVTNPGTGFTTIGPTTLDATHYNTVTWAAIPGACYYDIYLTSVSQANWRGFVFQATSGSNPVVYTAPSFKDTGQARYTTPGAGTLFTPVNITGSPIVAGSTSYTYYVYAQDADGHLTSVSSVGTVTSAASTITPTQYIVLSWGPVGGAVKYWISRGTNTGIIGAQANLGTSAIAFTTGSGAGSSNAQITSSNSPVANTVTVTVPTTIQGGGHGFKVGDTFTISHTGTADAHYPDGSYTVGTVTSASVFTYVNTAGGSGTSSPTTTVALTFTGVFDNIILPSFVDYGYASRTIGSATRNNTGDVTMHGQLAINSQTTGQAVIHTGNASNTSAMVVFQDSNNNGRFGVDSMSLPSLGSNHYTTLDFSGVPSTATTSGLVGNTGFFASVSGGGLGVKQVVNTGGSADTTSSIGAYVGLDPSGTAGGTTFFGSNGNVLLQQNTSTVAVWEWSAMFPGQTSNVTSLMGINASAQFAHPQGFGFYWAGTGNWQWFTDNGTTRTITALTVPVAPTLSRFQRFRIEFYGSATPVGVAAGNVNVAKLYIDGVLVQTITGTNVYLNAGGQTFICGNSAIASASTPYLAIAEWSSWYSLVTTPFMP